jgi:hypothetical protein
MSPRESLPYGEIEPAGSTEEDFDAIEDAVMETARGRWFLDQYATRIRARETSALMAGMRRLETIMAANHDALMDRIVAALAAEPPEQPEEDPYETAEDDLDLTAQQLKYFRADEDIFEPVPGSSSADMAQLAELAEQLEAKSQQESQKRRIVIVRHKPGEDIAVPLADDMAQAS